MGVASDSQLGSKERIDEKMEKIKQIAREAKQQLPDDGAEVQGLSMRVTVHRELLQQVEELQQEMQNTRERAEVRIKFGHYTLPKCRPPLYNLNYHHIADAILGKQIGPILKLNL